MVTHQENPTIFHSALITLKFVNLLETLLFDFCFSQDNKIFQVEADTVKPHVIDYVDAVGVGANLLREQFQHEKK